MFSDLATTTRAAAAEAKHRHNDIVRAKIAGINDEGTLVCAAMANSKDSKETETQGKEKDTKRNENLRESFF